MQISWQMASQGHISRPLTRREWLLYVLSV